VVRRSVASMSDIDQVVQRRLAEARARIHAAVKDAITGCADAVAAQARADCPVASGRLRDSVGSEIESDSDAGVIEARIFAAAPYAAAVELGSADSPPRPFLLPAAEAQVEPLRRAISRAVIGDSAR
jgi:HK97 gp10 family phage protein